MAFGSGKKESEKYCYNCMAILPTKQVDDTDDFGHIQSCAIKTMCLRCLQEVKPPEEEQDDKDTGN